MCPDGFNKAFDALPHGLLLAKLSAYGLSNRSCELIQSYLYKRLQRVKIGNRRSEWLELKRGILQGSVTGPFLFNVFLNDLFFALEGLCDDFYNYTDDNTLGHSHVDINVVRYKLENASKSAIHWFGVNFMKANPEKFQVALFSRDRDVNLEINIDGIVVKNDAYVKLLGVTFDRKLTFNKHISGMCRKSAYQLNAFARISGFLNTRCNLKILNAFILSNFMYCPLVWHFCTPPDTRKIEKVQLRALRTVYTDSIASYEELLKRSSKVPLYVKRLQAMLEVYKAINNMSPLLANLFTMKESVYNLRNGNMLVLKNFKT